MGGFGGFGGQSTMTFGSNLGGGSMDPGEGKRHKRSTRRGEDDREEEAGSRRRRKKDGDDDEKTSKDKDERPEVEAPFKSPTTAGLADLPNVTSRSLRSRPSGYFWRWPHLEV